MDRLKALIADEAAAKKEMIGTGGCTDFINYKVLAAEIRTLRWVAEQIDRIQNEIDGLED